MFEYQKYNNFFAQVGNGIEDLAIEEAKKLGAKEIKKSYRGFYFKADKEILYKINYCSKLISKILAPLITFDCHSDKYLYKIANERIKWDEIFSINNTFAIFSNVSNSNITHSEYASLKLKDAIVDYFRDKFKERPSINKKNPDLYINLTIINNRAIISLDTSGGSLHKRGFRVKTIEAPLQETLAAAIINYSKWDKEKKFYDIMCGSGTFLIEAILYYTNIPAGYKRENFGFKFLPDFDETLWKKVKEDSQKNIKTLADNLIFGSDISINAIKAAKENLKNTPFGEKVTLEVSDFRNLKKIENAIIICNPPYGIRIGDIDKLKTLYKDLGNFFKTKCKNSEMFILCGNLQLIDFIGIKPAKSISLINGAIKSKLLRFVTK